MDFLSNKPLHITDTIWMGRPEFDNTFVNADCLEENKLVFKFTPGSGLIEEYCLEFVPAEDSPFGSDLIDMDDNVGQRT